MISRTCGLLATIGVARHLGKAEFGQFAISQATIGLLSVICGFGMNVTASKYLAEYTKTNPARASRILSLAIFLTFIFSALTAVAFYSSAGWLSRTAFGDEHLARPFQISAVLLFFTGVSGTQIGVLMGFERFRRLAWINVIFGVISLPAIFAGALFFGLTGALWGATLAQLVGCTLYGLEIRSSASELGLHWDKRGGLDELSLAWKFGLPIIIAGSINGVVSWLVVTYLANQPSGYAEVGLYNAVLRIKALPETFLNVALAPMLPVLASAYGNGDKFVFNRTMVYCLLGGGVIIIPVSLFQLSSPHFTLTAYGPEYAQGSAVVQWMMVHALIYAVLFPFSIVMISCGKTWLNVWLNLLYAGSLAVLSLWLIPRYGAAGCAASVACAYLLAHAPFLVRLWKQDPTVLSGCSWPQTSGLTVVASVVVMLGFFSTDRVFAAITGVFVAISVLFLAFLKYRKLRSIDA